jgi:hypothetical protein
VTCFIVHRESLEASLRLLTINYQQWYQLVNEHLIHKQNIKRNSKAAAVVAYTCRVLRGLLEVGGKCKAFVAALICVRFAALIYMCIV